MSNFGCCLLNLVAVAAGFAAPCALAFSSQHAALSPLPSSPVPSLCPLPQRALNTVPISSPRTTLLDPARRRSLHTSEMLSSALFASSSKTEEALGKRKPEPDESAWRALVAALQMYRAAYGDLKVPTRFIVPAMPPWPENAWGLKLGQRVAAIRSTGKYVQNNESRRKVLEDMGFVWRLRTTSPEKHMEGITFNQIYDALRTYRQEVQPGPGALIVPPNFVVPDCDPWPESTRGIPLGKKLPTVRTKTYLKANPGAEEKLSKIGFEFDGKVAAHDARFNKVLEALKCYKEIYGDLLVPQPFVVPEQSEDWPEDTWGLRLGARVNAIRSQGTFVNKNPERKKQLEGLGFVWSPPTEGRKRGRRKKEEIEALMGPAPPGILSSGPPARTGKPGVASSDSSLVETTSAMDSLFGPSFGLADDALLSAKDSGKPSTPTWGFENEGDQEAARAAEEAKKAGEDEYRPPKLLSETLKEAAEQAVRVGVIEPMTEDTRIRKGKRDKDIPWFNDDFGEGFVFEDVVDALKAYRSMYPDFSGLVSSEEFVIPSPSNSFFRSDEGSTSDAGVAAGAAAAVAFQDEGKSTEGEEIIASNIEQLPPRTVGSDVAIETKQPAQHWPEHLSGMALGNIVKRIRDGSLEVKHLPERKAQLDSIDFDWGDPMQFLDVPFEKAMCAMYAYYLIRGDMFVYEDFVMPDEDPWPQALAGYEIGRAVKRIRELQNFMEAYHPEKVSLLRAIDFVWFPTLALPLDPNEGELSPEMLLVSACGHPDYSKMIDIPMGLPDKIVADGPFYDTDNPKLWWRKWHNWEYVKDYWYARGRRDNAYVLRGMGYPQLADEHEAKYGPGMFKQIDAIMKEVEKGVVQKSRGESDAMLKELTEIREEMTGCRDIHPKERKKLLEQLDVAALSLLKEGKQETIFSGDSLEEDSDDLDVGGRGVDGNKNE